jgi:Fe-S-cluster containining protein
MTLTERYPRTSCSCDKCRACCEHAPGRLIPEDIEHFEAKDLRASDGSVVLTPSGPLQVPTIIPAVQENGHCIFYQNGLCAVHEHSPFGCAAVDPHMDERRALRRSQASLKAILDDVQNDGPYHKLWMRLKPAEQSAAGRVQSMQDALRRIDRKKRRKQR